MRRSLTATFTRQHLFCASCFGELTELAGYKGEVEPLCRSGEERNSEEEDVNTGHVIPERLSIEGSTAAHITALSICLSI